MKFINKKARCASVIFMIIGICLISYPIVSTIIADYTSTKVVIDYDALIKNKEKEKIAMQKKAIKKFNNKIAEKIIKNGLAFSDYSDRKKNNSNNTQKNKNKIYKEGELEGYINIPAIDVLLPIYEGVKDSVLYKGVGHLPETSLPFGGKNTHCVLTGHSGYTTATLLDNLDQLKIDDVFYIKSLDKVIEYKVDNINIVAPDKAEKYISIEKGKDYCTLVTCTPKTINTHRLLVRGHRIPYDGKDKDSIEDIKKKSEYKLALLMAILMLLLFIAVVIYRNKKRKKNNVIPIKKS